MLRRLCNFLFAFLASKHVYDQNKILCTPLSTDLIYELTWFFQNYVLLIVFLLTKSCQYNIDLLIRFVKYRRNRYPYIQNNTRPTIPPTYHMAGPRRRRWCDLSGRLAEIYRIGIKLTMLRLFYSEDISIFVRIFSITSSIFQFDLIK